MTDHQDKQIDDKFQSSRIRACLASFPGEMLTFVKQTDSVRLSRFSRWLPLLLWRWYFLVNPSLETSPYLYLKWCHQLEDWPQDRFFFLEAQTKVKEKEIAVDLQVDLINFEQQPLLLDISRHQQGQETNFNYGENYQNLVTKFAKQCSQLDPLQTTQFIVRDLLTSFYQKDQAINDSFTKAEWSQFWNWSFKKMRKQEFLSSVDFSDRLINQIRQVYSDFALTNDEIIQYETEGGFSGIQFHQNFLLWLKIGSYFILPLSWYLHLVAPVFTSRQNFEHDINDILDNYCQDPTPLLTPFDNIALTNFGLSVLNKNIWN